MNVSKPAAASAVVIAAMLAGSAWAWPHGPAELPTHWGLSGTPDRWAPKPFALLLHPGLATVVAGVFAGLPAIMPRRGRLERSARAYGMAWVGVVLLLAAVHFGSLALALGMRFDVTRVIGVGAGLLLLLLGDLMGKVRYNYVLGVRTPWTLADERVWDRTHRTVGPWFMAWGAIVATASLVAGAPGLAAAAGSGAVVVGLGAVACSYLVARRLGAV